MSKRRVIIQMTLDLRAVALLSVVFLLLGFMVAPTVVGAFPRGDDPEPQAYDAKNADKVDGLHASKRPNALTLLALNTNKKFRASVIPGAITRDGEVMRIVKNKDGAGSGLDADLLDGQQGSYYRSATNINAGTLNNARFSAYSDLGAEGYLGNASGDLAQNNGALQTNLNADSVDGKHASAFASASHDHWGETWTGTGTGLTLSGGTKGLSGSGSDYGVYGKSTSGYGVRAKSSSGVPLRVEGYSGSILIEAWDTAGAKSNRRFKVSRAGNVYADGGYHCDRNIDDGPDNAFSESELDPCLSDNSPADFAEVLPAAKGLEPGDVLVVGPDGKLARSSEPYAANVVGVYSTRPSYLGNAPLLGQEGYVPLALLGIVPAKASAENGPIRPGDLLVASSTPGHAMRADPNPPIGTVIGKALEGLESGTGVIQILVTLQ